MEIDYVYYIVKFLLDLYKEKNHSNSTKSDFKFDMTSDKLKVKIRFKKF